MNGKERKKKRDSERRGRIENGIEEGMWIGMQSKENRRKKKKNG